jgi:hypothetical protein
MITNAETSCQPPYILLTINSWAKLQDMLSISLSTTFVKYAGLNSSPWKVVAKVDISGLHPDAQNTIQLLLRIGHISTPIPAAQTAQDGNSEASPSNKAYQWNLGERS